MLDADELMAQDCEEVKSQRGRRAYIKSGEFIAVECTRCNRMVRINQYSRKIGRLAEVQSICKKCEDIYRKENPNQHRKWREENFEKVKEKDREYREKNREKIRRTRRKYYIKNRKQTLEASRKYREENLERYRENTRKYRRENPEIRKISDHRRFARKKALPDNLTADEYRETCSYFENKCALSSIADDLHADHVIPLSIGHGGTTRGNVIPLSASLNISKSAKNIFEWFEANRQRFELSQKKFDRLIGFLAEANDMTTEEYIEYVYWCHENPRDLSELEVNE